MYMASRPDGGQVRRNLHERIAHELGIQIARGHYKENDLLPTEVNLADRYQVSRTAVREAFRILAAKGMITSRPKIGTRVRMRSAWNMLDTDVLAWHLSDRPDAAFLSALFEVRAVVDPEAAALAAFRRTDRHLQALAASLQSIRRPGAGHATLVAADVAFQQTILEASGNPLFQSIGTLIEGVITYVPGACLPAVSEHRLSFEGERPEGYPVRHSAVFAAIRDRDAAGARTAMAALVADALAACGRLAGFAAEREPLAAL